MQICVQMHVQSRCKKIQFPCNALHLKILIARFQEQGHSRLFEVGKAEPQGNRQVLGQRTPQSTKLKQKLEECSKVMGPTKANALASCAIEQPVMYDNQKFLSN